MHFKPRTFTLVVSAFFCLGCGPQTTEPVVKATLTTDRSTYVATSVGSAPNSHYTVRVVARYANQGSAPIYLATCVLYSVNVLGDSSVASAYNPVFFGCGVDPPAQLAPGQTRTDTLQLIAPNSWTSTGSPIGVFSGPVYLEYNAYTCNSVTVACAVPAASASSNVFVIQTP